MLKNKYQEFLQKQKADYNRNMILDNNLIAYEYFKNQFVPKEVYPSGERDESKLIDKYTQNEELPPVLIIEDDIINKNGYGLKKGFYNIIPDKHLDFLLIYQSGNLKAKVPVVDMNIIEPIVPKQEKPKKMSYRKYQREQEKKYRQFLKGENPDEIDYKYVEMNYNAEENAYLIRYEAKNYELFGVLKF